MQRFITLSAIVFLSFQALCINVHQNTDTNEQEADIVNESFDFSLGLEPPIDINNALKYLELDMNGGEEAQEEIDREFINNLPMKISQAHWPKAALLFTGHEDAGSIINILPKAEFLKILKDIMFAKPCYFYGRNLCRNGDACPYVHDGNCIPRSKEKKNKKKESKRKKQQQFQLIEYDKNINKKELPEPSNCVKCDNVVISPGIKKYNQNRRNFYKIKKSYPLYYMPTYYVLNYYLPYVPEIQGLHNQLTEYGSLPLRCLYFENSVCEKGDKCPYLHIDPRWTQTLLLPQLICLPVYYMPLPAPNFQAGWVPNGICNSYSR